MYIAGVDTLQRWMEPILKGSAASGPFRMRLLLSLSTILLLALKAQAQAPDLTGWKRDSLPDDQGRSRSFTLDPNNPFSGFRDEPAWAFVRVGKRWQIKPQQLYRQRGDSAIIVNANAYLTPSIYRQSDHFVRRVDDGYLIGVDRGEYGGGLYFSSLAGLGTYQIQNYLRIHEIVKFNQRIIATEGLAHMILNSGSLLEVYKEGNWKVRKMAALPDAPAIVKPYKTGLLIIGHNYISLLTKDFQVLPLVKAPYSWGAFNATSALVDKDDLYLAIWGGVLRIKHFAKSPIYKAGVIRTKDFDKAPEFEWYVPKH